MNDTVYTLALRCKRIAEKEIDTDRTHILYQNVQYTDYTVTGAIDEFRDAIRDLQLALESKYPSFSYELKLHNDEYRNDKIVHYTAMRTIVDCVLSLERKINAKRIFISHSSKDKRIVSEFNDRILQLGIGLSPDDIFCTSIEDMNIKNGEDIRNHIRKNILAADFSLLLISENYKRSEICLNEMGAVWAGNEDNVRYYLLPNTGFDKIGWLCDTKQAEEISNPIALDKLYYELTHFYQIEGRFDSWSRQRETFVNNVLGKKVERTNEQTTTTGFVPKSSENVEKMILSLLKDKPNQSLNELACSLGISKRAIIVHLAHLQESGDIKCSGLPRNKKWSLTK